jgi:hypothetical protein
VRRKRKRRSCRLEEVVVAVVKVMMKGEAERKGRR